MQILKEFPPIYAEILAAFPAAKDLKPIFAWGDRIYNPHGINVTAELLAHEGVHGQRQLAGYGLPCDRAERDRQVAQFGGRSDFAYECVRAWWLRYIADPHFRLMEELLAHTAEYRWMISAAAGYNRNVRRRALGSIALRLASPLYGSLISVADAKKAIADPNKPFRTRLPGSTHAG